MKLASMYVLVHAKGLTRFKTKLNILKKTLVGVNNQMDRLGHLSQTAFLAAGGAMALAAHQAIKFQKQLATVSTMLTGTAKNTLMDYSKGLKQLAVTYGESTETLSKGLYDILSGSVAAADALGVLNVAAKAATAGVTTTATSANALITILNAYGYSASRASEVSDILFMTVRRGVMTFEELAANIGKVATTAAMVGMPLEELSAILMNTSRQGMKMDRAANSLVGALRAFMKPTASAKSAIDGFRKSIKGFDLEMSVAYLETNGFTKVLENLNKLTKQQIATIFPNIRGLKTIAAVMQDVSKYGEDLAAAWNAGGSAAEAFHKQSQTVSFQLNQTKEAVLGVFRAMGDDLLPILKKAAGFIHKLSEALLNNSKHIVSMTKKILILTTKLYIWSKILKVIIPLLPSIAVGIWKIGASAKALGFAGAVLKLAAAFKGLALKIALVKVVALGIKGAIVAGIMVGIGALIYKYTDLDKILKSFYNTAVSGADEWIEKNRTLLQQQKELLKLHKTKQAKGIALLGEASGLNKQKDRTAKETRRLIIEIPAELKKIAPNLLRFYDQILLGAKTEAKIKEEASKSVLQSTKDETQAKIDANNKIIEQLKKAPSLLRENLKQLARKESSMASAGRRELMMRGALEGTNYKDWIAERAKSSPEDKQRLETLRGRTSQLKEWIKTSKEAQEANKEFTHSLAEQARTAKEATADKQIKNMDRLVNKTKNKIKSFWKGISDSMTKYVETAVKKTKLLKEYQDKLAIAQAPKHERELIALQQKRVAALKKDGKKYGGLASRTINSLFDILDKRARITKQKLFAQIKLERASSLRQTLIGTLPSSVQEKINAADARKAFIKQMQDMGWKGRKANQLLAEYDQSVEARKANKGAGQFEGIGDVWKRIQSGTMRPEVKIGQKTLAAIKDLGVTAKKQLRVLEAGQVARAG